MLGLWAPGWSRVKVATDAAGRFRFWGLPIGFRGHLSIPGAFYELIDPPGNGQTFDVSAPTTGLCT